MGQKCLIKNTLEIWTDRQNLKLDIRKIFVIRSS